MSTHQEELQELRGLLARQKAYQAAEESRVHSGAPAATVHEWLTDLGTLFQQLDAWTADIGTDLLHVEPYNVQVEEPSLPAYSAPARRLRSPSGRTVELVPRGRLVHSATGRVDLIAPPLRAMLVRFEPGNWQFATSIRDDERWQTDPLTEQSFLAVLKELFS
ncbi:MAG: hypothetical protein HYZ53_06865 [Planctomycetes bacterium]|nr:hypothetical protein [Planctomycetota bacterium]